ncbi:hypothetical protein A2318_01730 [Candidatus Uhrbacteria bacterium RIFOXYB2_FULL_45_11]|uniref:Toxin YoeB n=1 Tax=Candidatus Uhrbacteria bacterium RIFOXYB2_FULL_45_11 TaxID=1802421 RepID=A0A1F7W9L6_9BACT|nr:MAG: hypothetical protein A2318_01730 [Candidatus Uhrbacteria bacterium RIFOXYB2_FULL_45_11]
MMRIEYGNKFLKSVQKLPFEQQEKLDALLEVFSANPYDTSLHTKKLTGTLTGFFSFRISRDWRVIFSFIDPVTVRVVLAKHRKDIYRI